MDHLGKYSFGMGDRFGRNQLYQLKAIGEIRSLSCFVTPVWNKSFREHTIIGSTPDSVYENAIEATKELKWDQPFFVDADHITYDTVDAFIPYSNFFTIDISSDIDTPVSAVKPMYAPAGFFENTPGTSPEESFLSFFENLTGSHKIDGHAKKLTISTADLIEIGNKYFFAILCAKRVCNKISTSKKGGFVVELSIDEVTDTQSIKELFCIFHFMDAIGFYPDTIAPKFAGRFNKGVDYEDDVGLFADEFEQILLLIKHCVRNAGMKEHMKLSVHTGSDKFSLYPVINKLIKKHTCGIHLKTAGTTWLEEVAALSTTDEEALLFIKKCYADAITEFESLVEPYRMVIDIDYNKLPRVDDFMMWTGPKIKETLTHDKSNKLYNPDFRQLMHLAYKYAAKNLNEYDKLLVQNRDTVGRHVYNNILNNHLKPLFL